MKEARSKEEIAYVEGQLREPLAAINGDNVLKADFLAFAARRTGVDPVKFSIRLYSALQKGNLPSTVTCVLLLEFWRAADRVKARKRKRSIAS